MKKYFHGENGITFSLFNELDNEDRIINFLFNVKWNDKPELQNLNNFQIHLFPSLGRNVGLGEPDVVIACNKYLFIIEVETDPIRRLSSTFFKQLRNFYSFGQHILKNENRHKIRKKPLEIENKKVKGKYRTRKLLMDFLESDFSNVWYIVITNDHIEQKNGELSLIALTDKLSLKIAKDKFDTNKLGWIGFPSITRLSKIPNTVKTIQFNLKV